MGRPRSNISRTPISYYMDNTIPVRMDAWVSNPALNTQRLTAARAVEAVIMALTSGQIVLDASGNVHVNPHYVPGTSAPPALPPVPVTRFETPYVAQPAPPPMPFTPQNHDVVDLSPPETYKEINARRLNFVRWLLETVGRTADAAKITPAALNSTSTTFFLPDHPLAKSWDPDGPVGVSQKERAKRVLDAGHFNAYLETTVNDLLAVCDHRQV